jgi:hypothetical protein
MKKTTIKVFFPHIDLGNSSFWKWIPSCASTIFLEADCPYIVGGDINILRDVMGKNKPTTLAHSLVMFNFIIHTLYLWKIHMSGSMYTWSNKQKCPTLKKLDRILMSPDWELLFPLVVKKLVKDQPDHSPLLLNRVIVCLLLKRGIQRLGVQYVWSFEEEENLVQIRA